MAYTLTMVKQKKKRLVTLRRTKDSQVNDYFTLLGINNDSKLSWKDYICNAHNKLQKLSHELLIT